MVSRAVWGQSWTKKLLEPIAGVFVFELPGVAVFREGNFSCCGDSFAVAFVDVSFCREWLPNSLF